jgi:hypothetical protein
MPQQRYVVTAPYVTLKTATVDGIKIVGFYQYAPVPEDVDPEVIKRHLAAGSISKVGDEPDPEPGAAQQADQDAVPPVEMPLASSPKGDWVEYAVSQGMARSSADSLTKGQLQDAYAGSGG